MNGISDNNAPKTSKLKWLLPLGLFVLFVGGIMFSRGRGALSFKEIPNLASLDQAGNSEAAPDFIMINLAGKKVALSDFRGKAVLLNFWSINCPACQMQLPSLVSLSEQLSGKPFALVAVTSDSMDDVRQFLDATGLTLPVYFDPYSDGHQKYGVAYFPANFVIDPEGRLVDQIPGAADWSAPQVITYFQKLIEISQPKTPRQ